MIDYYFYFDRKDKKIMIFKENCYVRTRTLLKTDRILEAVNIVKQHKNKVLGVTGVIFLISTAFISLKMFLRKKKMA